MSAETAGRTDERRNLVGPVLQTGELAEAVIEAIREDNPGKEVLVERRASYVRVQTERECVIRRETVADMLGRPFKMQELEVDMSAFAGQIETSTDHVRFYREKIL